MEKKITNISVGFNGTEKGKRKAKVQRVHLDTLDGHVKLTPEQIEFFENKARETIKAKGFKVDGFQLKLFANFGKDDGEMRFVEIFPSQSHLFSKGLG